MVWPVDSSRTKDYSSESLDWVPRQLNAEAAPNYKSHDAELLMNSDTNRLRFTAIWCSLGTNTCSESVIYNMLKNGVNIVRLSYSSGTYEYLTETIKHIRKARATYSQEVGRHVPLAISTDDVGPVIQIGYFKNYSQTFETGQKVNITTDFAYYYNGSGSTIYISYDNIHQYLSIGDRFIIDFGAVILLVTSIMGINVICVVESAGILTSRVKVHVPGVQFEMRKFTEDDQRALNFAIREKLDIYCPSGVDCAEDVRLLRKKMTYAGWNMPIIPKIANRLGIKNIEEILSEADGVFIGRGYVGDDLSLAKCFLAQKSVIAKCNEAGKPICVLGQLLTSMLKRWIPTRAENLDIANVALDGASSVMTHNETTTGDHPIKVVKHLDINLKMGESAVWYRKKFQDLVRTVRLPTYATDALAIGSVLASYSCLAAAIIVLTQSGKTAGLISKYFPRCPVLAVTRNLKTVNKLCLYKGVVPLYYEKPHLEDWCCDVEARIEFGIRFAKESGIAKTGDPLVIQYSLSQGSVMTNAMRIIYLSDIVETITVGEEESYQ